MDIFFVAAGPRYVRRRPGTTAVTAYPPALLLAASRASSITSASMSSMCPPISRAVAARSRPIVGAAAQHQELCRSSTDPEMIRLRPNLATPSLPQELRRRRRCEETAARTVRTPAAPELAVGRRLGFAEGHHPVELRPNPGKRAWDDTEA